MPAGFRRAIRVKLSSREGLAVGVLNAKDVEAKLRELHGNMAAVGRTFGVSRAAVFDFVKKRPGLRRVVHDCRESMKDLAESALYRAVIAGEAWAVTFFLKTQGRDRGYSERHECEHSGTTRVE